MSDRIRYALGESSLGLFIATVSDHGLIGFEFGRSRAELIKGLGDRFRDAQVTEDNRGLVELVGKLERLVDRPNCPPSIPLDLRGSDFDKAVWSALRGIPSGTTLSYGALAAQLGGPDVRDVTKAIAANTIAILVPCHRVIKKDGAISGYRWGVWRKRALLKRENAAVPQAA
jgi:AraC family transcriptional regulator of adaptative response/methylated-DNA-[protein]-cysteine methyltransferase